MASQVRASHILIKHDGSRRKASWKDPEGQVIKNTSRDSAVSQLKALRDDILSGKVKFEDVASRFSDCSSAKRGGDLVAFYQWMNVSGTGMQIVTKKLSGHTWQYHHIADADAGPFGRGQMQKPFEETTYSLKIGDISDIVDTDSGVHVIKRTG